MNTYHCTRNQPYQNPICRGHTDLEARSGFYITADSEQEAITQMAQLYPNDTLGFTVELWIDDNEEFQPDDSNLYLYRLYRKSKFFFLGGEPLAEEWATEAEVSDANDARNSARLYLGEGQ